MIEDKGTLSQSECMGGVNPGAGIGVEKTQISVQNSSSSSSSENTSNNLGGSKGFSTCRRWMVSGRFQDILPRESLTMSLMDWEDLYRRERLAQVHHSVYTNSGCFLQLDQRQLVMSWISDSDRPVHVLSGEGPCFAEEAGQELIGGDFCSSSGDGSVSGGVSGGVPRPEALSRAASSAQVRPEQRDNPVEQGHRGDADPAFGADLQVRRAVSAEQDSCPHDSPLSFPTQAPGGLPPQLPRTPIRTRPAAAQTRAPGAPSWGSGWGPDTPVRLCAAGRGPAGQTRSDSGRPSDRPCWGSARRSTTPTCSRRSCLRTSSPSTRASTSWSPEAGSRPASL
ncbi:hypothetical protein OIY81_2807 [Cryptosporidium canis]|uniref:Uncharacterized protein n=1 Tax=Cryptosporidium canis TaxID=195482 RepID=A0ABQ8P4Y4_9CRYT|nr:hypothetical protein OIY81_2807 [Cryptosporidium canis]KAJ1608488.1 hypothetical protein OJ252_2529 [Cryptosporidium canis]